MSVDLTKPEGGVVWTQEYLRYRVNQCDHPTSVQKVFSQIDGGGVAATCFVTPCLFTAAPTTQTAPAAGGNFTAVVTRTSGDCAFGAESLGSFVSIVSGISSSEPTTTLTLRSRAKPWRLAVRVHSSPMDEQLDAARDQPAAEQHRVLHDRSAERLINDDDHLLDQIDGHTVRVCSDGSRHR